MVTGFQQCGYGDLYLYTQRGTMRGDNHFSCYGYCVDHAYLQSDYGLYGHCESASSHVYEQYFGNVVTGFQQCCHGDLHVYPECGTMRGDNHFSCYGYCVDHANVQSDYGLYGCS